jgi:hypothetical protein
MSETMGKYLFTTTLYTLFTLQFPNPLNARDEYTCGKKTTGLHPSCQTMNSGCITLGIKLQQSFPFSAEVKTCTPIPPLPLI